MKKTLMFVAVAIVISGCAEAPPQPIPVAAVAPAEAKADKTYSIVQENGEYYVIRGQYATKTTKFAQQKAVEEANAPKATAPQAEQQAAGALPMNTEEAKKIVMPKSVLGIASQGQIKALTEIVVDSHNTTAAELQTVNSNVSASRDAVVSEIKNSASKTEQIGTKLEGKIAYTDKKSAEIREIVQKLAEQSKKGAEAAQKAVQELEALSKTQGSGAVTVFFPAGKSKLADNSIEYMRLVNFADRVSMDANGKKALIAIVGSASVPGDTDSNQKLSEQRVETAKTVLDKYLVDTSHEFYKVYGVGDTLSPDGRFVDDAKYQSARVVVFFDASQAPALPVKKTDAERKVRKVVRKGHHHAAAAPQKKDDVQDQELTPMATPPAPPAKTEQPSVAPGALSSDKKRASAAGPDTKGITGRPAFTPADVAAKMMDDSKPASPPAQPADAQQAAVPANVAPAKIEIRPGGRSKEVPADVIDRKKSVLSDDAVNALRNQLMQSK